MNISIDYRFKPFDMSPVISLMNDYKTLYEKEQQMYDTLSLKLGDLSSAVEGTTLAKGIYDKYMEGLDSAATNFTRGRNIDTARELSNLRRMYATDIRQLELARESMLTNTKLQLLMHMKDPSMILQNIGNLDTYLLNPTYTPKGFSGRALMEEVGNMAKVLSTAVATLSPGDNLDKFTKTYSKLYGLSTRDILKAIHELRTTGRITDNTLWNMVDGAVSNSGVKSWGDDNLIKQAYEWAGRGLNFGIGKQDVGTYTDELAKAQLDVWKYDLLKAIEAAYEELKSINEAARKKKEAEEAEAGLRHFIPTEELDAKQSNRVEREKATDFIKAWRAWKPEEHNGLLFMDVTSKSQPTAGNPLTMSGAQLRYGNTAISNKDYWNTLVKKYGTKSPSTILKKMLEEEQTEILMYLTYRPNTTNYSNIISIANDNLKNYKFDKVHPIEDGKIKTSKSVKDSEYYAATEKGAVPLYSARLNTWIIVGTDKDGNTTYYAVPPEIIDSTIVPLKDKKGKTIRVNRLKYYMDNIQLYSKEGNDTAVNDLVDEMMAGIIATSNSRILTLGDSTTNEDVLNSLLGTFGMFNYTPNN